VSGLIAGVTNSHKSVVPLVVQEKNGKPVRLRAFWIV